MPHLRQEMATVHTRGERVDEETASLPLTKSRHSRGATLLSLRAYLNAPRGWQAMLKGGDNLFQSHIGLATDTLSGDK
jgi:hypothetical protein